MTKRPLAGMVGAIFLVTAALLTADALMADSAKRESCTVVGVGRLATADGSVITSHTDCCSECRIQVVPGRTYPKGSMAPVHWGMVYFGAEDDRHAPVSYTHLTLPTNRE